MAPYIVAQPTLGGTTFRCRREFANQSHHFPSHPLGLDSLHIPNSFGLKVRQSQRRGLHHENRI